MVQKQDIPTEKLNEPRRDPGSFRDPSGFVCHLGKDVFRVVDHECAELVGELKELGLLDRLQAGAALIPTRIVQPGEQAHEELKRWAGDGRAFLHHQRVPFISYPQEWSAAMLADAAACCLDLQMSLITEGYCLKDASVYNVQFVENRPVFIDVPSIETARRRDVWPALDQFHRMFLYPLLLNYHRKCSIREYFASHIDGLDLQAVYRRFGHHAAWKLDTWFDVWLPYQLQRFSTQNGATLRRKINNDSGSCEAQLFNLRRLKRKVRNLVPKLRGTSHWVDYASNNSYDDNATGRKQSFISSFLKRHQPSSLLDIGSNTGTYSRLAAQAGARVVAIDSDHACIDAIYQGERESNSSILPLVVDIANPTPGIGFNNTERPSFLSRCSFDCVFALALVHHLLVTARLPLESICDLFAKLTSAWLIIEYVGPKDPMFVKLLGARDPIYDSFTYEAFVSTFRKRFDLMEETAVAENRKMISFKLR